MDGKKRTLGAAGGAVGLGTFSAGVGACCSAPWVVGLVGVSGAVAVARLAFVVPYALAAAILLMAVAFWLAYRRRPAGDGDACGEGERRRLRRFVWVAALLVAGLVFLTLAPLVGA